MNLIRPLIIFALLTVITAGAVFAQSAGSIGGTVTDANGAVVPGATVSVWKPDGTKVKDFLSNAKGEYAITGLAPGKYVLKAIANGFDLFEKQDVAITAGQKGEEIIVLMAAAIKENVDVQLNTQVSTDPDANKDATILSEKDLEALPDDPDELAAALQALVGAQAGPNGGQIYIDGFMGGQLPPKESIREIRINSNPFSAEYDRPGNGRIEILTRPGTDKFRGGVNGAFNDESLNSRNPFAANRAPTQQRRFGANFSGPIKKGKSSFFIDGNHRSTDNNSLINAQILDPSFNIVALRQDVRVPSRGYNIAPRFDFMINSKNTAVVRYGFNSSTNKNQGIGDTALLSRASNSTSREHELRVTETMIINPKTVNETRFELSRSRRDQNGDNSIPAINVSSAFSGGGATVGHTFNENKNWELNNFTSTSLGKNMQHSIKFGGKLRHVSLLDHQERNYAGTFGFNGFGIAAGTTDVCDINSDRFISSIEQYRCKVQGIGGTRYNPTQFSITTGNPELSVSQTEGALFLSDDWKLRPDFLLSVGVRYENQTNLHSRFNFAPRLGIAWSPGAGSAKGPLFVLRAGGGIFYDRFGENNTLNALRNNGVNQLNLLVNANDPDPVRRATALNLLNQAVFTLTGVTNVPTGPQVLAALPSSNTITQITSNLQAPYQIQGVVSVEKSFFRNKLTAASTFMFSRNLHQISTRNINAPICPNFAVVGLSGCSGAPRPQPTFGNILAYESNRTMEMKRIGFNVRVPNMFNNRVTFGVGYGYGIMKNNNSTPIYAYDLSTEWARANAKHNLNFFGNFNLPYGFSLSPNVNYTSEPPFNITLGSDQNGDGSSAERPTFGALALRCNELHLTTSWCNVSSFDPTVTIPRNWGEGHENITVGLRLSRTFSFGTSPERVANNNAGGNNRGGENANRGGGGNANRGGGGGGRPAGGGGGGGPQMIMMGGGGGGMMMMGGPGGFGGGGRKPYNLNLSIQVSNLFNHVNLASPVGQLNSFRFGQSVSTGGGFGGFGPGGFGGGGGGANRRVELQARFNW